MNANLYVNACKKVFSLCSIALYGIMLFRQLNTWLPWLPPAYLAGLTLLIVGVATAFGLVLLTIWKAERLSWPAKFGLFLGCSVLPDLGIFGWAFVTRNHQPDVRFPVVAAPILYWLVQIGAFFLPAGGEVGWEALIILPLMHYFKWWPWLIGGGILASVTLKQFIPAGHNNDE